MHPRFVFTLFWFAYTYLIHDASGYVAPAPRTYTIYDASSTVAAHGPKITNKIKLRQAMDPDSQMAKQFASRPLSYASVSYSPVKVNNASEECVLWDSNCKGSRSAAIEEFFNRKNGTMGKLLEDACFTQGPYWDLSCTQTPKPAPTQTQYWSTVRRWMRQPACETAWTSARDMGLQDVFAYPGGCCGGCAVGGPNVDVYYWKSPNASTDCLTIVGTTAAPLLAGATTAGTMTYWGVTTPNTDEYNSIMTTALYTSINGVTFKQRELHRYQYPIDLISYTATDCIISLGEPLGYFGNRLGRAQYLARRALYVNKLLSRAIFNGITNPCARRGANYCSGETCSLEITRPCSDQWYNLYEWWE